MVKYEEAKKFENQDVIISYYDEVRAEESFRLECVTAGQVFFNPLGVKNKSFYSYSAVLGEIKELRSIKQSPKNSFTPKDKSSKGVSVYTDDTVIYEQIFDPITQWIGFIKYDSNTGEFSKTNEDFAPITDEDVTKKFIVLPTDVAEYGTTDELLQDIREFLHKYCEITPSFEKILSYYVLLTWIQDKLATIPYIKLLGDKGTGKTRLQNCMKICYKPLKWVSNTPATTFRTIDRWKGTLIFEEFIPKDSSDKSDIMQILNSGYEKGTPVPRYDNDAGETKYFDPYGAKILSTRFSMDSSALESRCINYITREKTRKDIPILLGADFTKEQEILRNKILLWRLRNWHKIDTSVYESIQEKYINTLKVTPRIAQSHMPLMILFYEDEKYVEEFIQIMRESNEELKKLDETSFDGIIIQAYVELFLQHGQVETPYLKNKLQNEQSDRNGKYYNDVVIGRHLKQLGFNRVSKMGDGRRFRVYEIDKDKLIELAKKYCYLSEGFIDEIRAKCTS